MLTDFIQNESLKVWTHIFWTFLKKITNLIKVKKQMIREKYDQKQKERELHKDWYAQKIPQIDWL